MPEFLAAMVLWPTVVFTALLGVVAVYWVMVLVGALELGKDAHVDMEGGHADLDGHGHHVGDGHAHSDADFDADADVDGDGDGKPDGGFGVLKSLGLSGVPLTVIISLLALYAWAASMLMTGPAVAAAGANGTVAILLLIGLGGLALVVAVPVAAISIKPLRPMFEVRQAPTRRDNVGKNCTVLSGSVTATFGQAEIGRGNAIVLIHVRCEQNNELKKGDSAVVFDYDADRDVYLVAPNNER